MPDELRISERPQLRDPVLIAAFRGWNDGAQGASLAAGFLARAWSAERFADIDPEGYYDFQATRPHVSLVDGFTRKIEWPENAFYQARIAGTRRDAVLLLGIEPSLRWRTFTGIVAGLAKELGVTMMVTLGALLADVPHTRPAPVTGSASDPDLVEELGLQASRYEGPTGIVGVLHDVCRAEGIPSVSLWAAVPHYVSLTPSPRAAKALCERLGDVLGVEIDTSELDEAGDAYTRQVSEAVASDPETAAYVEELEERAAAGDEEEDDDSHEIEIPSGDSIAAELSRYLREREQQDDEGGPPAAH